MKRGMDVGAGGCVWMCEFSLRLRDQDLISEQSNSTTGWDSWKSCGLEFRFWFGSGVEEAAWPFIFFFFLLFCFVLFWFVFCMARKPVVEFELGGKQWSRVFICIIASFLLHFVVSQAGDGAPRRFQTPALLVLACSLSFVFRTCAPGGQQKTQQTCERQA